MNESQGKSAGFKKLILVIVVAFGVVFVAGTIAALASRRPARVSQQASALRPAWEKARNGTENFAKLGKLRLTVKAKEPILISVSPVLAIPAGDKEFRDELITKSKRLRADCIEYFSGLSVDDLNPAYEGLLKAGLRERLNQELLLGKIYDIYFPDYRAIQ
jgi:flagellar basal body-associated protein FliL